MTGKRTEDRALISVIVPVYNAEPFLEATVASIRAQTDTCYEIILVDDGSSDRSLELCRRLASEDHRIRVISQCNKGVSAARNAGVRAAEGDYISFVDSDDLIKPSMIADLREGMEQIRAAGHTDVQVQIGREEVDENGNRLPDAVVPPEEPVLISPEQFTESLLLYTGDASFCTKLTPKRILESHPFAEGRLAEDFSLQVGLTDVLEGIYSLPQVDYRVIHRSGSLTRRKDVRHFSRVYVSIVEAADAVERELVPGHPKLAVPAERFALIERLDYLLHVPIPDMTGENTFYTGVVQYLRRSREAVRTNPYLSRRERFYLQILSFAPRFVRRVHLLTMKIRGIA